MIDLDAGAPRGEHQFQSAMQSCLCVVLPDTTTACILFTSDSTVSFNFILALRRYSNRFINPLLHWPQLHNDLAQNLLSRTLFSSAAPMPGTSFSQYFLQALLMSSPLTFFINGALPFEFLLYFHILYLRHFRTNNGLQHFDRPFKVTPFAD